jgi:hypothetical protein
MQENKSPVVTRNSLIAATLVSLIFGGLLVVEGRPWCCKYGLGFWSAAWQHCTSQHFADPYWFSHVLHGIIFYWFLRLAWPRLALQWRLFAALVIEIGWELLENSPWVIERYRQQTASLDYTGDSIVNSCGDVIAAVLGFWLASRISWKAAVAIFIATELVMLWSIRDNLTLNVLMLFLPLDGLKEWQMQMASGIG